MAQPTSEFVDSAYVHTGVLGSPNKFGWKTETGDFYAFDAASEVASVVKNKSGWTPIQTPSYQLDFGPVKEAEQRDVYDLNKQAMDKDRLEKDVLKTLWDNSVPVSVVEVKATEPASPASLKGSGRYIETGKHNDQPYFVRDDCKRFLFYSTKKQRWVIDKKLNDDAENIVGENPTATVHKDPVEWSWHSSGLELKRGKHLYRPKPELTKEQRADFLNKLTDLIQLRKIIKKGVTKFSKSGILKNVYPAKIELEDTEKPDNVDEENALQQNDQGLSGNQQVPAATGQFHQPSQYVQPVLDYDPHSIQHGQDPMNIASGGAAVGQVYQTIAHPTIVNPLPVQHNPAAGQFHQPGQYAQPVLGYDPRSVQHIQDLSSNASSDADRDDDDDSDDAVPECLQILGNVMLGRSDMTITWLWLAAATSMWVFCATCMLVVIVAVSGAWSLTSFAEYTVASVCFALMFILVILWALSTACFSLKEVVGGCNSTENDGAEQESNGTEQESYGKAHDVTASYFYA